MRIDIEEAKSQVSQFLERWNREDWMQSHGDWEEGLLDPHDLADEEKDKICSASWQGWDCTEGYSGYITKNGALVLNWWRNPYGKLRHYRDLWVMIDDSFVDPR